MRSRSRRARYARQPLISPRLHTYIDFYATESELDGFRLSVHCIYVLYTDVVAVFSRAAALLRFRG